MILLVFLRRIQQINDSEFPPNKAVGLEYPPLLCVHGSQHFIIKIQ